jgi:hypothetical protein
MDQSQDAIDQAAAAAKARFEAMAHDAMARAERDRELAAKVQAMTATVSSRRGEATVVVDHGGRVTDLRISDRGMELSADDLSRVLLETIRQAGATVGQSVGNAVRESWGDDSPETARTVSSYDVFGAAPGGDTAGSSDGDGRFPWNIRGRS